MFDIVLRSKYSAYFDGNQVFKYMKSILNIINEEINTLNTNQQQIVSDILSLNEDFNGVLNKILQYGKRGLLTMAIIFAVAQGVQANQIKDVISTGIEYVDNRSEKDFYSACIGYLAKLSEKESTDPTRKAALMEARIYFENLRDGIKPNQLSNGGKIVVDYVLKEVINLNSQSIQILIDSGRNLTTKGSN